VLKVTPSPRTAAQIRAGGGSGGGRMNEVHRDKETGSAHGRGPWRPVTIFRRPPPPPARPRTPAGRRLAVWPLPVRVAFHRRLCQG